MAGSFVFRDIGVFGKTIINTVPTQQGGILIPAIVGFGRDWFDVTAEAILRTAATVLDTPANLITRNLNRVGDTTVSSDYVVGVDVQVGTGGNVGLLEWLDNSINDVTGLGSTTATTGGTIPDSATNFFIVTAVNGNGETDETGALVSETSIVTAGGNTSTVTLAWSAVNRATSYRIYYSATGGAGNYANSLLVETVNTSITLLNITTSAVTPPVASTAFNKPIDGNTYFATYDYWKALSDYAAKLVTNYSTIQTEYGGETINTGTFSAPVFTLNPIGLAASLAFENGAQSVFVVQLNNITTTNLTNTLTATSGDGEINNAFVDALKLLEAKSAYYILSLSTAANVRQSTFEHVSKMSAPSRRMEREMLYGYPVGTAVGDPSTPASMLGIAQSFNALGGTQAKRVVMVANQSGTKDIKNDDGSSQTLQITGEYWSAALAGKQSGRERVTLPINRKPIFGITDFVPFSEEDRLTLQGPTNLGATGCAVVDKVGETVIRVGRMRTTASDFIENTEITTVQQIDVVMEDMRTGLEQQYIIDGDAVIDENTPILIQNSVNVRLRRNVNNKLISKFFPEDTSAEQDQDTPTLIKVVYKIKLVYPLLNVELEQVVSLS